MLLDSSLLLAIILTLIIFPFSWFLHAVGKYALGVRSVSKLLSEYEKAPENASWIERYYLLWGMPLMRKLIHFYLKIFGDRLLTFSYIMGGAALYLFSIVFLGLLIGFWAAFVIPEIFLNL